MRISLSLRNAGVSASAGTKKRSRSPSGGEAHGIMADGHLERTTGEGDRAAILK